jgi:hypothetical protein
MPKCFVILLMLLCATSTSLVCPCTGLFGAVDLNLARSRSFNSSIYLELSTNLNNSSKKNELLRTTFLKPKAPLSSTGGTNPLVLMSADDVRRLPILSSIAVDDTNCLNAQIGGISFRSLPKNEWWTQNVYNVYFYTKITNFTFFRSCREADSRSRNGQGPFQTTSIPLMSCKISLYNTSFTDILLRSPACQRFSVIANLFIRMVNSILKLSVRILSYTCYEFWTNLYQLLKEKGKEKTPGNQDFLLPYSLATISRCNLNFFGLSIFKKLRRIMKSKKYTSQLRIRRLASVALLSIRRNPKSEKTASFNSRIPKRSEIISCMSRCFLLFLNLVIFGGGGKMENNTDKKVFLERQLKQDARVRNYPSFRETINVSNMLYKMFPSLPGVQVPIADPHWSFLQLVFYLARKIKYLRGGLKSLLYRVLYWRKPLYTQHREVGLLDGTEEEDLIALDIRDSSESRLFHPKANNSINLNEPSKNNARVLNYRVFELEKGLPFPVLLPTTMIYIIIRNMNYFIPFLYSTMMLASMAALFSISIWLILFLLNMIPIVYLMLDSFVTTISSTDSFSVVEYLSSLFSSENEQFDEDLDIPTENQEFQDLNSSVQIISEKINIFLQFQKEIKSISVSPKILVSELMKLIRDEFKIANLDSFNLQIAGKSFHKDLPLFEYGIGEGATLSINIRMIGGGKDDKKKNASKTPDKSAGRGRGKPVPTTTTTTTTQSPPKKADKEIPKEATDDAEPPESQSTHQEKEKENHTNSGSEESIHIDIQNDSSAHEENQGPSSQASGKDKIPIQSGLKGTTFSNDPDDSLDGYINPDHYDTHTGYLEAIIQNMAERHARDKINQDEKLEETNHLLLTLIDKMNQLAGSANSSNQNSNSDKTKNKTSGEKIPEVHKSQKNSTHSSESTKSKKSDSDNDKFNKFVNETPHKKNLTKKNDPSFYSFDSHSSTSSNPSTSGEETGHTSSDKSKTKDKKSKSTSNVEKTNNFDVKKEVGILMGTEEQRAKYKRKTADVKFSFPKTLEIYQDSMDFNEWWKSFKNQVQACRIVGFMDQIELSFRMLMNSGIQDFFDELQVEKTLTLEDMIVIVLSNHTKVQKSHRDYRAKLREIRKKSNETVNGYYLRFDNLAKLGKMDGEEYEEELQELFLVGLTPQPLMKKVSEKRRKKHTLEDLYQIAVAAEQKHFEYAQLKKLQEKQKGDKPSPPNPNKTKQPSSEDKKPNPTNQNGKNNNNKPQGNQQNRGNNNKTPNPQKDKTSSDGHCRFCGKTHNYKECQEKYPFYYAKEIQLLNSINRTPSKRTSYPEKDKVLTKDTEWIKKLLEQKQNTPNNSTPNSNPNKQQTKVQATTSGSPNSSESTSSKK